MDPHDLDYSIVDQPFGRDDRDGRKEVHDDPSGKDLAGGTNTSLDLRNSFQQALAQRHMAGNIYQYVLYNFTFERFYVVLRKCC